MVCIQTKTLLWADIDTIAADDTAPRLERPALRIADNPESSGGTALPARSAIRADGGIDFEMTAGTCGGFAPLEGIRPRGRLGNEVGQGIFQ